MLPSAVLLTINADIGPSTQYNWAAIAWTLAQAVVMTIAGSLGDILGRRNFTLAGNLLGLIGMGSGLCNKTEGPVLTEYRVHHCVQVCSLPNLKIRDHTDTHA